MKKQTIIKIATLLLISLTLISCNPDNDGIFWRMSISVPKVDVGAITLIAKSGNDLYAYTTKKGPLQKYSGGSWSVINSDKARHFTADATHIYFAKQAEENKPNEIWSYKIDDETLTEIANGEHILSMVPTFNLVLVKNGNNYDVKEFNILTLDDKESYNGFFNVAISPQLIASSNTDYIISGLALGPNSKYVHYDKAGDPLVVKDNNNSGSFEKYPIIAFSTDGTDNIVLNSSGAIWFSKDDLENFEPIGTIPSFSAIEPAFMPYPNFIHGGFMYLQNSDYDFYKVDISDGSFEKINSDFATKLNYVQANSFLVDGQDVYVGTVANGIFKINMTNNSATSL
jgi:hypothetical protein